MAEAGPVLSAHDYHIFQELARRGNHEEALELIKEGVKPLQKPPPPLDKIFLDGSFVYHSRLQFPPYVVSPSYVALQNKCLKVFEFLVTLCPSIISKLLPTALWVTYCYDSETLLHLACRDEAVEAIRFLLERGAAIEIQGCRVGTPLHLAAEHGRLVAIELLLDSGADLEARDSSGNTPLHMAVAWDKLATVQLLLKRGADLAATSHLGDDVFSIAISRYAGSVLEFLCKHDASPMFSSGRHAVSSPPPLLLLAAFSNRKKSISYLLDRLTALPECPPALRVDALLINACCGIFSTRSVAKFRDALRMKEDLQGSSLSKALPSASWYGGKLEVQTVQEWDKMEGVRAHEFYLQRCIILERCLGNNHHIVYEYMVWFIDYCIGGYIEPDYFSKLQLRLLDMFISREQLKLKYCINTLFQVQQLVDMAKKCIIRGMHREWIGHMLKGLEVFTKMRERHDSCTFFKASPTCDTDSLIWFTEAILDLFLAWILSHRQGAMGNRPLSKETHFQELVDRFVRLCHTSLMGRGVFSLSWPHVSDKESQTSLLILLKALLQSEALSYVNMPDPQTGVRPLHKAFHTLGSDGAVLMLSHGAHLDSVSRKGDCFIPGRAHTTALSSDSELPSLHYPLPLLCQCSWAVLKEKIPYHQLGLPSRIKDYIALHETP